MPIVIDFLSNVRKFITGTDDVEAALKDVSDSLDDVAKDARSSADKMGKEYEGAARDIDQASERLERSFSQLADQARDQSRRGGDATRKNYSQAMKFGAAEVRAELSQNMAETFSSFDGDLRSFADGIQGTFGGLVASIGPLLGPTGILAAVAGAAGIGLLVNALEQGEASSEEMRARISELTDELIETGGVGKRSLDSVVASARELAAETDSSKVNLETLERLSKLLGVGLDDVTAAYLRGGRELDELIDRTDELIDTERARINALDEGGRRFGNISSETVRDLEEQRTKLEDQRKAIEAAQEAELRYLRAGVTEFEVKKGLIEAVNDAYDDAAGSIDDFINAETGVFDVAAYITAMQAREQALRNYQDTLATTQLSPEAIAFLNSQGAEAAAGFLAGYVAATPDQRAELERIWTEAGRDDSATYTKTLSDSIRRIGKIPGPEIALNNKNADDELRTWVTTPRTVTVTAELVTRKGRTIDE